ncbi:hypothetical protein EDB80DRAFT_176753 [Ilyonectria destructans]|nr:hypothetical protein EDB80DRAFT_176753 [Ilyonectria destructans]
MTTPSEIYEVYPLEDEELVVGLQQKGGHVKSSELGHLGTIDRSGYSIVFQRLFEVHGKWEKKQSDNASLLAIKISPRVKNHEHHFKQLKVVLTVELAKGTIGNAEAPSFDSYEPGQQGAFFLKEISTKRTDTVEGSIQLSGQVPSGPSLSANTSKSRSEESDQRRIHSISAKPSWAAGNTEKPNQIEWTLKPAENSDGIGDYMVVALLVLRARGSKFQIRAESNADISFFTDKLNVIPWNSKVRMGPFGPARDSTKQLWPPAKVNLDDKNLSQASADNILGKIAFVHVPEKLAPRALYSETAAEAGVVIPSTITPPSTSATATAAFTATSAAAFKSAAGDLADAAPTVTVLDKASTTAAAPPVTQEPLKVQPSGPTSGHSAVQLPRSFHQRPEPRTQQPPRWYSAANANSRALRHRRMASLYRRLAQLHMEEAEDAERPDMESYADQAEAEWE